MAVFISGFFRCLCGKIHCVSGISTNTKCKCGLNLNKQMLDSKITVEGK